MGEDKKVTIYRRQHRDKLDVQRKARKSVGWVHELYADLSELDPEQRQRIEISFFSRVDGLAYEAVSEMLRTLAPPADNSKATAWARFLMSLLHRHPANIELLRNAVELKVDEAYEELHQQYSSSRKPGHFEVSGEFTPSSREPIQHRLLMQLLPLIVDSQNVGAVLLDMNWAVGAVRDARFGLLTSDRPLLTSDGLGHRESFLVLPISPQTYFLAAKDLRTIEVFRSAKPNKVISWINHAVCLQATEFVISRDEEQTKFIDNRLGGSHRHQFVRNRQGSIFWENPINYRPW